jgi:ABC-type glycerol-3-phosphate transport system permease component
MNELIAGLKKAHPNIHVNVVAGAHHTDWNLTMAATVLVMAPVILVFFFAQKAFVEGVTLTGVKG